VYIYEMIDSLGRVCASTDTPADIGSVWTEHDTQPGMTAYGRIDHVRRVWVPLNELA